MKRIVFVCIGIAVASGLVHLARERSAARTAEIAELQNVVTTTQESLLGYTRYRDYLSAGKQSLSGQSKLLAASVSRQYVVNRRVERSLLGAKSNGVITVSYIAEYAFGYDLSPNSYELVDTQNGIELRIGRPTLIAPPAIHGLHNEVLASGLFTDEKLAALQLYEEAASRANADGLRLQADEEVMALCEKRLTAFLRDFLAKQPGVGHVPAITVAYVIPSNVQAGTQ